MKDVIEVTAETFEREVLKSDVPVLVDLYATWCPPCRALAPTLEKVAAQWRGKAKVVKINTDQEPELAAAFGVQGVPTLVMIHQGRAVDGAVGLVGQERIESMLDKALPAETSETTNR